MRSLKTAFITADLSTRGKRRNVTTLVAGLLKRIRAAEQTLIERMPLNLQGSDAYDATECFIELLDEAIDAVSNIYD
jgi:hypothetical protein